MSAPWLRPLGVGERIDASIKLYLRGFRTFAPAVLATSVPIALLFAALGWWQATAFANSAQPFITRNFNGTQTVHWGVLRALAGTEATTLVLGIVLFVAARAVAYRLFADTYLGLPATWRTVLTGGLRRFGSLLLVGVLIDGADLVVILLTVGVIAALAPLGPGAIVLMLPPSILCLVFVVWWWASCRLSGPSVMMEDVRGIRAVRRSIELVRGTWWSVFGTALLAWLMTTVVTVVLNLLLRTLVGLAVPTTDVGPHAALLTGVEELANLVVIIPFFCSVGTVLAVDMRVGKEGLDLEMLTHGADVAPGSFDFLPTPRTPPPVAGPADRPWLPPPGQAAPPPPPPRH